MKIALFHNVGAGGAKRQIFEQAKALAARGHVFDLFTTGSGDDAAEYLPLAPLCRESRAYGSSGAASSSGSAATVAASGTSGGDGALRTVLKRAAATSAVGRAVADAVWVRRTQAEHDALSRAQQQIARDIDVGGYDAVYVCQCRRLLAPDLLRFLGRTPAVFCCNDTLRTAYEWAVATEPGYDAASEIPIRRKSRGRFLTPAVAALDARERERFVANTRVADAVLANSWYTRDRLATVTGVNAQVVYPGVDADFYCPDPRVRRDPRLIVSVGALTPSKRHDFVIRAAATLPPGLRPRVEVFGYEGRFGAQTGPGPEARRLCALAADCGVELSLRHDVTDETIRDAYRRAGAVVFAPYLEPLGLVPLEAMACSAAVVGVAEAGIRETIRDGETGLLTGFDPAEFGAAVEKVLRDACLAERLGAQGRQAVQQNWTWQRSADGVETALSEVAARGRHRRQLEGDL